MSIESEIEGAFKAALIDAGVTADIRAFWLDDEVGEDDEDVVYPAVILDTKPAVDLGSDFLVWTVPMDVIMMTHYMDDRKRSALLALYDQVRDAVNDRNFQADLVGVGSGVTFNAVIVTGGSTGVIENEQAVSLSLDWEVSN